MTWFDFDGKRCVVMSEDEFDSRYKGVKVGRDYLAKAWGISPSTLSEQPYRFPKFDAKKGQRNAKWFLDDVNEHVKKDINLLREEYRVECERRNA